MKSFWTSVTQPTRTGGRHGLAPSSQIPPVGLVLQPLELRRLARVGARKEVPVEPQQARILPPRPADLRDRRAVHAYHVAREVELRHHAVALVPTPEHAAAHPVGGDGQPELGERRMRRGVKPPLTTIPT